MAMGDHIQVPQYGILTHDGIDCGDGKVVEYSKERQAIQEVTLEEFAKGRPVSYVRYEACLEPAAVVSRARSRVGEKDYHLFDNNCEHFATWCKTGKHHSRQVDAAWGAAGAAAAAAVAGVIMLGALLARGRA